MDNLIRHPYIALQNKLNSSVVSITYGDDQYAQAIRVLSFMFIIHLPFILALNAAVMVMIKLVNLFHTPENYIVSAMAFSDFMLGIFIIFLVAETNPTALEALRGTREACIFRLSFASLFYNCSMSFVMLVHIERSLAVNTPFCYSHHMSNRAIAVTIACVFAVEVIINVVLLAVLLEYNPTEDIRKRCEVFSHTKDWYGSYFHLSKLSLELTVVAGLSLHVYAVAVTKKKKTAQQRKRVNSLALHEVLKELSAKQRIALLYQVQIMALLTVVFIMLWLPLLLIPYVQDKRSHNFTEMYRVIAIHLLLLNSSMNPVLYALRKSSFRRALHFLMTEKPSRWGEINLYMSQKEATFLNSDFVRRENLKRMWRILTKKEVYKEREATLRPKNEPDKLSPSSSTGSKKSKSSKVSRKSKHSTRMSSIVMRTVTYIRSSASSSIFSEHTE